MPSLCADELVALMVPIPMSCLGWFCLGYHLADAPSRVASVRALILASGLADADLVTEYNVAEALKRILNRAPSILTMQTRPFAAAQPLPAPGFEQVATLSQFAGPVVPYAGTLDCTCGRRLVRWKLLPAVFLTLAAGLVHGHTLVLRCFHCHAAHAGVWCWDSVPEVGIFPAGFHNPRCTLRTWPPTRWFFATPQVVWEEILLVYFLHCLARGGMSLTAASFVYDQLWHPTMVGTMYAIRPNFVSKLCVALLTWSVWRMMMRSGLDIGDFKWYLRPRHVSTDFADLLVMCQKAFNLLVASHRCRLWDALKAIIVDGKWCVQTAICNERGSGQTWNVDLRTGFFKGCTCRPMKGAYFCARYQADATLPPEQCAISQHREVVGIGAPELQYMYNDCWTDAASVPATQVRSYEMGLLRARKSTTLELAESCNRDSRKDVSETSFHGRKSGGILVAVTPCLQIVYLRPMYGSESLTQVLLMVAAVFGVLGNLAYVMYDNACSMVRHLRKQEGIRQKQGVSAEGWSIFRAVHWVIDRLHCHYHRCWRDPEGSWYVPNVRPDDHPVLIGVDTEAAEQVFHIANRWQLVLSNAAPVHHELFLLLFAHEHNRHHDCTPFWHRYSRAQAKPVEPLSHTAADVINSSSPCVPGDAGDRNRKRKAVATSCEAPASEMPAQNVGEAADPTPSANATESPPIHDAKVISRLHCEFVAVNEGSKTIHGVDLPSDVYSKCSWSFQYRTRVVAAETLKGRTNLYTCGICFQVRAAYKPV